MVNIKFKIINKKYNINFIFQLLNYKQLCDNDFLIFLRYYLPNKNLPTLTLIGSSNFGERSVNRDLETQICVVTINKMLQQEMQNEYDYLSKHGKEAEQVLLNRPIPNWVKAVVSLFRNFF